MTVHPDADPAQLAAWRKLWDRLLQDPDKVKPPAKEADGEEVSRVSPRSSSG